MDAATPKRFFLNFSKTNYYLDLPFSVAECISLNTFWHKFGENLFAMITRYDVISSKWLSHF